LSHTATTAALSSLGAGTGLYFAVGTVAFGWGLAWGLIPAAIGIGATKLFINMKNKKYKNINKNEKGKLVKLDFNKSKFIKYYPFGNASLFLEALYTTMLVGKKLIGLPINSITGNYIVEDPSDETLLKKGLDEVNAKNYRANITAIARQFQMFVMQFISVLIASSFFKGGDDDDDDETKEIKEKHNEKVSKMLYYALNFYQEMHREILLYSDPLLLADFIIPGQGVPGVKLLDDMSDFYRKSHNFMFDRDSDFDVINKRSKFLYSSSRFYPRVLKALVYDYSAMEKVFEENAFINLYPEKKERLLKQQEKGKRARYRMLLEEQGYTEKEAKKKTDEDMPTEAQQKFKDEYIVIKKKKKNTRGPRTRKIRENTIRKKINPNRL